MGYISKNNVIIILLATISILVLRSLMLPPSVLIPMKKMSKKENDYEDNLLILYNRIPKTGSTSFMSVLYNLHLKNRINIAFVNVSSQSHRFTFIDKYKFALNITKWSKRKPAIYHGHFPFVNFNVFSLRQPIYINIVRKPLERFVSHYYFIRYGDTYLPKKVRKYQGDTRSFDDCIKQNGSTCDPKKLWLQIPYFCGSEPECWEPGSRKALQKAKANVIDHYFLVGITEEITKFIEILEKTIPRFFRATSKMFLKDGGVRIRQTKVKKPLLKSTVEYFKGSKVWVMENEFYNFVKRRFQHIYKKVISSSKIQFSYVKVKPD